MDNKQLDAILEYLNDEDGIVTLEQVYDVMNENVFDKVKKSIAGFKPLPKSLLGGLFKSNKPIDYNAVMEDLGLEKIEGHDDLYTSSKFKIQGKAPYIHAALNFIAPYANNMKLFLEWSGSDVDWEAVFKNSFASRAKIDFTDVQSDCKKKLACVYVTKGFTNDGYALYKCYCCYSIKSKTLKNAKYHSCLYQFDGRYESTGWSENDVTNWGITDLVK